MIRSRALKRIKRKTPGNNNVTHFKKFPKRPLFKSSIKLKREQLKEKVRK